ncbi:Type I Iterative PKS [Arachnomyces sp. PD_36]|nr:Type I Iterative PKS [Arachnomyces sp. PD_36]
MGEDENSVALTGLSCKFPGDGDSLDNFRELIYSGKSAWSKIPRERFNVDGFWSPSKNRNTSITQGGHFLKDDISKFDANFFSIPKNEVEAMDPQHRIMLEVAYEALEQAGLPLDAITGTKTGVFMGNFTSDYKEMIYRDPDNAPSYTATGTCRASLANRISWLWDLRGPSITLDTACSSSLVALHLACQSLRTGDSDIAIVGGTSLLLNPDMFMHLSNQAFLSPDGKCKSFDESANGYGRGEGFGCVVLKRVDDAISAQDPIRAVIRGTGSNQDGHTKGFTLPSADAQAELIRETYRRAGVDMKETGYFEAHGTGTQAGDVQETKALSRTICGYLAADRNIYLGSVKSNIGHLEAAAGIAGIIKAVLILESGLIPPSINFSKGNPNIKFDEWKIQIPIEVTPWPTGGVRRISTNSFGYGGANAHAILEDADSYLKSRPISHNGAVGSVDGSHNCAVPRLFVVSAQDKDGLGRVKTSLASYVRRKATEVETGIENPRDFMLRLAYTLSERRSHHQWKTSVISSTLEELCSALDDKENASLVARPSQNPRIGFIFTGQGAQWPRMGIELMDYPVFKESVMSADRYLREECECPWSVAAELQKGKSTSQLHLAEFSQALCTVLQVALIDLLRTWNIVPTAVAGHSSGEIGAAYCMGALSKEDAWKIAYYRGVLSSELKTIAPDLDGSMMAVGLSQEKAEEWLSKVTDGEVVVACVNSPSSVTISGDTQGIDQLLGFLKEDSIFARKLQVDTAYHSPHMQAVAQDYYEVLADISTCEPASSCTMHSSTTGSSIDASQLGAVNWVRNLTSPVQFSTAVYDMLRPKKGKSRLTENAVDLLIEIGPHSALRGPATQTLETNGITNIPYHSVLTRNEGAFRTALTLAGSLFALGSPVDMCQVNIGGNMHSMKPLVDLPTYPWNHSQRYWHESRVEREYLSRAKPKLSLLGAPSPSLGDGERLWRGFMRLSEEPWIADHKMQGSILYPGAGFLAMALEAASQTTDGTRKVASYKLRDIQLTSAAVMSEGTDLEFIVQLRPHISGTRDLSSTWTEFTITSSPDGKSLVKNCYGLIIAEYEATDDSQMRKERDCEIRTLKHQYQESKDLCQRTINPQHFYSDLASLGFEYGPAFTNLYNIHNSEGRSVCTLKIPDIPSRGLDGSDRPHVVHPGVLDAVFHLAFAAVKGSKIDLTATMVPKSIDEVTISAKIPFEAGIKLAGYSTSSRHGFTDLTSDIVMLDENENIPVIEIEGLLCAEIGAASSSAASDMNAKSITSKLTWRPAIEFLTLGEQGKALERYEGFDKVSEYLQLLHHSNPALSILEILPGSQTSSSRVLSAELNGFERILRTGSLTIAYQDAAVKAKLENDPNLKQSTAIELLDTSEGFAAEQWRDQAYDVIIASGLSDTATKLITNLLKKDGRICVLEAESFTDGAQDLLHKAHMETAIIRNIGEVSSQKLNLIIAKNADVPYINGTTEASGHKHITILQMPNPSQFSQDVAADLSMRLETSGYTPTLFIWGTDTSQLIGKKCISLVEMDKPLLRDLTENNFTSLKQLILGLTDIFWVVGFDDPSASMIDGLARTVRNETPSLSFRIFHTGSPRSPITTSLGDLIGKAFDSKTGDDEFLVKDNLLHVGRIEEDMALNGRINDMLPGASKRISTVPLGHIQYPTKLCIRNPGMLDSLCLEPDELPATDLADDFIEVRVKATALNFREVMAAMGQLADSKLGLDAAGVVHRVGSAVTKFKVGDRVAMCGHGSHRTLNRCRADSCALIPEGLSFEQAASIPTVHGTAWYALVRLAKVQKGQSILIHAAAGGVGQAAIQTAKHFEMEIFVSVSSEAKRKLIRDEYDVPDDHILNSRDLSFVKGIKRMTNNRGVDVILNSLSGEFLRQTWHCIAPFGHFIEIGLKDIISNTGLDMRPFMQDATFSFFNLSHIESSRPDILAAIVEGAFDFQRRGITRPIQPLVIYPISDMEGAFRLMQTGKHVGKIALTWGDNDVVPVIQKNDSTLTLDSDAAYMLAGGLGGLGRSLAVKLADLGARKLCFLSRSGGKSGEAKKLAQDLEQLNVQVRTYKCDIADEDALAAAVEQCKSELGDIRGVFQCAMVLRDTLFVNMSYEQWVESTRPKVQGSWNLHKHLPDVDFFIMLSSFAAIFGNRGQSNYAAAGAYEDALAYHRRSLGQHATTVDLGIIRDVGVLAETGITDSLREWEKAYGLREAEFLALIERAISGDMSQTLSPQILTGLATGGSAVSAGINAPYYLENPRFAIMAKTGTRGQKTDAGGSTVAPHTLISQATSLEEASGYVLDALMNVIAKMLQTTASEIDTSRFLYSCGVDSLVAIEIINWALKELKSVVTVFDVLAAIPITALSTKMAAKSSALPKELIPVAIVSGVLYWALRYWPAFGTEGHTAEPSTAGYVFFMTMLFFLFMASWGQWITAFAPSFTVMSNTLPLFFIMVSLFNGVVRPYSTLPAFWKYTMY